MAAYNFDDQDSMQKNFFMRHPIIINLLIILMVAFLGMVIVYLSIEIFTKHDEKQVVPSVTNMSYTQAVEKLQKAGFNVEISDSTYISKSPRGFVLSQSPKAGEEAKPGRKVFLSIVAVNPKEVILDDENKPGQLAMKDMPARQAMARLNELGFTNVKLVYVLGDTDCVMKVMANGKVVRKLQKVPVNAKIIVEIADNRLSFLLDSLQGDNNKGFDFETNYPRSDHYYDNSNKSKNKSDDYKSPSNYIVKEPETTPKPVEELTTPSEPEWHETEEEATSYF